MFSRIEWKKLLIIAVLVSAGLLIIFQTIDSPLLYLDGVLSVAWNHQLVTLQSWLPSWQAILVSGPYIIIAILLIEHIRPWRKLQKRFREEFRLDLVYNIFSFGLYNVIGGGAAFVLIGQRLQCPISARLRYR